VILYCLLIIFFPASRATRVDFAWSRIGSGFLYPSCTCRIVNTACLLHWRYQGKITSEGALHLFSDLETSTHSLRVVICLLSKLGCPVALGQVLTLDGPKTYIYGLRYLIAGMDIIPTIRTRMGHSPSTPTTSTKVDDTGCPGSFSSLTVFVRTAANPNSDGRCHGTVTELSSAPSCRERH